MIWFTSDWHLGHTNITGPKVSKWPDGYRDFETTKEMDETIINTCNKYVGYADVLYYLGDFCLSPEKRINHRSRVLVQEMHAIVGNHDKGMRELPPLSLRCPFNSVQDVLKITVDKTTIFMSHYAHRVWPHSHKGCIHLYGHSHGSIEDHGKSMDVGVDVAYKMFGEYRPFSFDEIVKIMEHKKMVFLDHHGERTNE